MYKKSKDNSIIIRISDNAAIPKDNGNIDYQAFLRWLDGGNTPSEAQTAEEEAQEAIDKNNARIKEELLQADLKIIRALVEENTARINQFKSEQSERRRRLVPPGE